MVRIGLVGIGFMGMIHYLAARHLRDGQVTAICSRDPKKLAGDWRSIKGNFGPPGQVMDLAGLKRYERLDDLLADPDIDLVDVCNPTQHHASTALAALAAGKHVLVEKPIALDLETADRMLAAARGAGRQLLVAQVLPFFPEFAFAAAAVRSGRYGKLRAGHFKRVIAQPDWSAAHLDVTATGGPAIDLHIHDTHFIGLVAGVPREVFATGVVAGDAVTYLTTQYLYGPGGPAISCSSGALAQPGRPFVHGYELYLDRATLVYESSTCPLTVLTADGQSEQPTLAGGGDPVASFASELQAAVDGARANQAPDLLSGQLARDALALCLRECDSVRSGRAVVVAALTPGG